MNLYFWAFSFYAFMITPVSVQAHILIEKGFHYRFRFRAAGLPVLRKIKQEQPESQLRSVDILKNVKQWDAGLAVSLIREGHLGRLWRLFQWRDCEIHARISFEDAALTAMAYAVIRTVAQTWGRIHPPHVRGRVEMDFQGQGAMLSLRCIASVRLGSLLAAAVRLWLAAIRYRSGRLSAEEENYASASH